MSGFGDSLTTVGTTQLHPLGTIVVEPATQGGTRANQGEKSWIYVYNDSGSALDPARMQTRKAGSATYHVAEAGAINPAQAVGMCAHAIPNGSYGFIARKGIVTAFATGAVAANKGLILAAAGEVADEGAVTGSACGNTLAGNSGSGAFTAYIDCKG